MANTERVNLVERERDRERISGGKVKVFFCSLTSMARKCVVSSFFASTAAAAAACSLQAWWKWCHSQASCGHWGSRKISSLKPTSSIAKMTKVRNKKFHSDNVLLASLCPQLSRIARKVAYQSDENMNKMKEKKKLANNNNNSTERALTFKRAKIARE